MENEKMSFSTESYPLDSCTLFPLSEITAGEISSVLAGMVPWRTLGYSSEGLYRYFTRNDPALLRYALVVSGGTAGMLCARYPWLLGPYVELLVIFEGYQGKGLGREVIEWLERRFAGEARNFWATVSSFNEKARSFYQRLGFKEVAVLSNLVTSGFDEILLHKKLLGEEA